jgi:hypothetical protein
LKQRDQGGTNDHSEFRGSADVCLFQVKQL